uniref:PIN domain-containing protein n=1 Tax=Ignisphaera aggregans TaxID=334771 RepID=A0A7J2U2Z9_9CREN
MTYIDTNVIISFVDEKDPNHEKALMLINKLPKDRATSMLTLVELASVYSRAGLEKPLALALYSIDVVKARIIDTDFNTVLRKALTYTHQLELRTLDLLHIVTASTIGCKKFVTFDSEIIRRSNAIANALGIEVVAEGMA